MNKMAQPVLIGLILGVLTIILAEMGGVAFGKFEDNIRDMLKAKASVVQDQEQATENVRDAWGELKRAHSHAEGLGTIIVAVVAVIAFTKLVPMAKTLLATGIGLGGLLYPVSIVLEALRIPAIGEEAARDSVELLVIFSVGLLMLCLGLTLLYLIYALFMKDKAGPLKGLIEKE